MGKDTVNRNCPCRSSDIELKTDFKSAIIDMLKELKKTMSKKPKVSMRIKSHKIENNHELIAIIRKRNN